MGKTYAVKLPKNENENYEEITLINGWHLIVSEPVTWDEL